ncbi:MAG: aminoacyl--tRNA ligase-related protein [Patescibacteria group bacterium]|jgi:prolyl-tRNA synthetase
MLQSKLFGKTLREAPRDEQSINAQLLQQAGYVEKLMAGVYSYLPLGYRVLKKIEGIIREEMQSVGATELLLPALHPKENWVTTGRWDGADPLYKIEDSAGHEYALGSTHEEVITPLVKRDIQSYRDLPMALYQFQTKFRAELRAKSGLLRGREFIMKDLYSFHRDEADLERYYEEVKRAYARIFDRCGIGAVTLLTFASGGSFSKYSHEFQTLTPAGEDTIYVCQSCRIAINHEIIADQSSCPSCGKERKDLVEEKSIEVGNIFALKTKYSAPFSLMYKDETGLDKLVVMGCYGIGLGRLMGTIAEVHHDGQGIIWPKTVAPFSVHLLRLGESPGVMRAAEQTYQLLGDNGVEVLFDDRELSAGIKFKDADLLGVPIRVIVSGKTVAAGGVELKMRGADDSRLVPDLMGELKNLL